MLEQFAKRGHDEVYEKFHTYKTTLFLCGAGKTTRNSVKEQIATSLSSGLFSYLYDIFYPEDLFDELLLGPGHHDLLSLENTLADSVDAVVLVIESYGAVAELGAFASNDKLRKKLVCVVDAKYKRQKSFIQYGPLRLLRDKKEGEIVYGDYSDVESMIKPIKSAISKIRKSTTKVAGVTNVVQAHHFVLPCILLLEPVPRKMLVDLVRHASGQSSRKSTALAAGAIAILTKNREIVLTASGYELTLAGTYHFDNLGWRGRTRHLYDRRTMDELRTAVLTWRCRNKKLIV